jgi:hypothetical protein
MRSTVRVGQAWSSDAGVEFLDTWFSIAKICQYFRTRSKVTMLDIDGWHARDLITPLFLNDNTELHTLIRKRLILPYLTGSFHPSFIEDYAGGLLTALQKPDGGIRSILCGEVWRRCFASLGVNATPIRTRTVQSGFVPHLTFLVQNFWEKLERRKLRGDTFHETCCISFD